MPLRRCDIDVKTGRHKTPPFVYHFLNVKFHEQERTLSAGYEAPVLSLSGKCVAGALQPSVFPKRGCGWPQTKRRPSSGPFREKARFALEKQAGQESWIATKDCRGEGAQDRHRPCVWSSILEGRCFSPRPGRQTMAALLHG